MEKKKFIYHLITLEITNGLDKQQKEELQSWLNMAPENRTEYNVNTMKFRPLSAKKLIRPKINS